MQATVVAPTVSFAYSPFACTAIPDEILLISGFRRGRGGKEKIRVKYLPSRIGFEIYTCMYIFLDGIARLRGFDFSPVPFKTQRNENATGKSFPLLFHVRVYVYTCVRVCSTHVLMVPAFIFIFPFVSNVSRYIRMSSVAQLGFSFTFWSRVRPDFPPFFPLPLFPRVCINFFFFLSSSERKSLSAQRNTCSPR